MAELTVEAEGWKVLFKLARHVVRVTICRLEVKDSGETIGVFRGEVTQFLAGDRVANEHRLTERQVLQHSEDVLAQPHGVKA